MSITAIRAALASISETDMTPSAKLVLIALANRHNQETGRCDPSVQRLAGDLLLSERAVRNALRELETLKLIETVARVRKYGGAKKNLTNRYRIRGFRGGANSAGRVGQILPPKQESIRARESAANPSAFDDLAMMIEDDVPGAPET